MEAFEQLQYLVGSQTRVRLLESLRDRQCTQAELTRELGIARSTVHTNIRAFEEHGWVRENQDGTYSLTYIGKQILSAYRIFSNTVEQIYECPEVVRALERAGFEVPIDAVAEASVTQPTRANPHAPAVEAATLIRSAQPEKMRIVSAGINPYTTDAWKSQVEAGCECEIVTDRQTLMVARREYYDDFRFALASDAIEVYVVPEPVEFSIILTAEEAMLFLLPSEGGEAILVHGSNESLRELAMRMYVRLKVDAKDFEVVYPSAEMLDAREVDTSSAAARE